MTSKGRCIVYHIDADNKICFVNREWSSFAAKNQARHLDAASMVGRPILQSITDRTSRHLYSMMIQRIRRERKSLRFSFRCDAPDRRRWIRMEMFPTNNDGVGFKSFCVKEESREPVELLNAAATERTTEFLKICSWCKKVEVGKLQWVEVEVAINRLALFKSVKLPQLTHGICPGCCKHYKLYASASAKTSPLE